MTLSTKIAHNTIIQIISKIIATVLGLLTIAIMTRYLGKSGFGDYTTIITYLTFFATIADLGLTLVTVQLISKANADEEKIIGNLFAFRLVTAVLFLGSSILITIFLPYSNAIKIGIAVTSFSFLFGAFNQILVGVFQKNLQMDRVALAEVVSRTFLFVAVFLVYYLDYGLLGVLIVSVLANLVSFLFHFFFSQRFVKTTLLFEFGYWKQIVKQSWPIAVTIFFNLIYLRTDTLILSLIKSSEEVGIYGASYKVIDVLVTVPFMFAGIILPVITRAWSEKNNQFFYKVLQRSFDVMIIFSIPMLAGAFFLADPIINLIAGPEFAESASVLRILMIASSVIFVGTMFSHAVIAIDKQKNIIWSYIFVAITALSAYLIFIPKFSYFGAAWVTVYSEVTIALASLYLVYKHTKFFPNFKVTSRVLLSTAIMSVSLYYFVANEFNFYFSLFTAMLIYFGFLYLFKGFTNKEILEILNKN
mgnify:CR=1 FL=1